MRYNVRKNDVLLAPKANLGTMIFDPSIARCARAGSASKSEVDRIVLSLKTVDACFSMNDLRESNDASARSMAYPARSFAGPDSARTVLIYTGVSLESGVRA